MFCEDKQKIWKVYETGMWRKLSVVREERNRN